MSNPRNSSPRDAHPVRDIERILALVGAATFAVAIGVAGFVPGADTAASRALPGDANAQRGPRVEAAPPVPDSIPSGGDLDPALRRIDLTGAHHG